MKLVIEDYGNNVYATLEGETLVKQWLDGEFTERKLNAFVKKFQKNYKDKIEIVRKEF